MHTTGSFQTSDGLKIHTEAWLPEGDIQAVVLLVHGLGEHVGRYGHVGEKFNSAGYAVYGLDHRGHGKSEGLRAHFDRFEQPINDLKQYLDRVKAAQPGKKLFIYGHSLGSLITLNFLLKYQREFAGAIISGTPLEVEASQPKALVMAASLLNGLVPKMAITPPLPASTLSHDPAVVAGYDADPLVYHGNVRVSMGYQIFTGSREVKNRMRELTLPMLIFHGSEDKLCPPSGSEVLNKGVGASDKTLKFYQGFNHECHNEVGKETVLNDMVTWLKQRTV